MKDSPNQKAEKSDKGKTFFCPHCRNRLSFPVICKDCKKLIKINDSINYFDLFNLPVKYSIDERQLEESFTELAKLIHPDLYTDAPPEEQIHSMQIYTKMNTAYNILKDPLKRAEYLLDIMDTSDINIDTPYINKTAVNNEDITSSQLIKHRSPKVAQSVSVGEEFLDEILDLREQFEKAVEEKNNLLANKIKDRVRTMLQETKDAIHRLAQELFDRNNFLEPSKEATNLSGENSTEKIKALKEKLEKIRYINNLAQQIGALS